jgi:hypothetical protein
MADTRIKHQTAGAYLGRVKKSLAMLLMLAICHAGAAVPAEAQRGRLFKPLRPTFGGVARVAESRAVTGVAFTRLPRQSIAPAFGAAGRSTLTREGVTSALRSAGIRRRAFNVAAGSTTRTARALPAAAKLPAINSGTYAVGRTASESARVQAFRQAADIRKLISPNLSPKARLTLGKSYSEATGRAAAASALEKQAAAIDKIFNKRARLHKNSRLFRAPSHVYVIVTPDGRLFKVGESSAGLLKNGLSKRAQTQVNRLNRKLPLGVGGRYRSRIIKTFDSKQEARDYEREIIVRYREKYKDRRLIILPGNHEPYARLK